MTRRVENLLFLATILTSVCFLAGLAGWSFSASPGRVHSTEWGTSFHAGKSEGAGIPDPRCKAEACHGIYPHERGTESAFRNLHVGFVECPVCHDRGERAEWRIEAGAENRWRIRTGTGTASGDPHPAFGPPVRCRGCHSQSGRERIERQSARKLPGAFIDPVPLRMLEGGSRKWVPDGM